MPRASSYHTTLSLCNSNNPGYIPILLTELAQSHYLSNHNPAHACMPGCKTSGMTSAGKTKWIEIEVGLHQGSAHSPLLFVIIMDVITEDIEEGTPWAMLFAGDMVLCDPDKEMM